MDAPVDLFYLFRSALVTVCSIYALLQIGSTLRRLDLYLTPTRRDRAMVRGYILVHLLRLRVQRFAFDLVEILILLGALVYIVWLHYAWPGSPRG